MCKDTNRIETNPLYIVFMKKQIRHYFVVSCVFFNLLFNHTPLKLSIQFADEASSFSGQAYGLPAGQLSNHRICGRIT